MKVYLKINKNLEFYKKLAFIAVPIMLQNGITNFVSLLDNVMVGQIGTNQMTGVAIINQLLFVFQICILGAISGPGIFGAQFYGNNDHEGLRYTFRIKLWICMLLTAMGIVLFGFGSSELISLYLHDADAESMILTLQFAEEYGRIMMVSLPFFSLSQIYSSTLREEGQTLIPMAAGIAAVIINLFLDYILIMGKLGSPALGVKGAAIATVISRMIECAVNMSGTHRNPDKNPFIVGAYSSINVPLVLVKKITIKGMPLVLNEALWAIGMALINQCYALHGLAAVAALNISNTITNVFTVVYLALGSSVSIIIGNLLGAGKLNEAREKDRKLFLFSVNICIGIAILQICFAKIFPELYNTENEVKALAEKFIIIAAAVIPLQAFTNTAYETLRSGGQTIVTFLFDSGLACCVVLPFAFWLSKYTELSIVTVYLLVQFTEIIKCMIGYIMVKKGGWIKKIV
ncbi:MAG: MATE family efflux transporter [Lachnospiraceae bacterium]|nr:MATE family efflux transporter [Lachnospiraceae bacterium]